MASVRAVINSMCVARITIAYMIAALILFLIAVDFVTSLYQCCHIGSFYVFFSCVHDNTYNKDCLMAGV